MDVLYVGRWWNDRISIMIFSGRWRFFQHKNYTGDYWDLGPGPRGYPLVDNVNIPNDVISSFACIRTG